MPWRLCGLILSLVWLIVVAESGRLDTPSSRSIIEGNCRRARNKFIKAASTFILTAILGHAPDFIRNHPEQALHVMSEVQRCPR